MVNVTVFFTLYKNPRPMKYFLQNFCRYSSFELYQYDIVKETAVLCFNLSIKKNLVHLEFK